MVILNAIIWGDGVRDEIIDDFGVGGKTVKE
jgi:hypothetical protein